MTVTSCTKICIILTSSATHCYSIDSVQHCSISCHSLPTLITSLTSATTKIITTSPPAVHRTSHLGNNIIKSTSELYCIAKELGHPSCLQYLLSVKQDTTQNEGNGGNLQQIEPWRGNTGNIKLTLILPFIFAHAHLALPPSDLPQLVLF